MGLLALDYGCPCGLVGVSGYAVDVETLGVELVIHRLHDILVEHLLCGIG